LLSIELREKEEASFNTYTKEEILIVTIFNVFSLTSCINTKNTLRLFTSLIDNLRYIIQEVFIALILKNNIKK
jgi:hypothetical protein